MWRIADAQHTEDRDRDQQTYHRVSPLPADRNAARAEQHGQAGEPPVRVDERAL